ncbi:ATP-binding cassette domain-containing protein [Brachybacterium sp. SGAir0954]|uniref:ATP-binding cassette domain-containing protein n=1 Tax=Brachybacterium sp. SGAir0954 TaxID=2571029 RepID=UPI001F0E352F|nr:ATP-binding cassette domain-containing protein [Brachybacterium sp. SGAir0954]
MRDLLLDGVRWRPTGRDEPTLDGLRLHVPGGQKVLLTGVSGSGKSTVLRALAGLLDPEAGDLEQAPTGPSRPGERGLLLQNPAHAVVGATVARDAAIGPENAALPRPEIHERVRRALEAAAVDVDGSRDPLAVSGGQQQRVALAGALALHPEAMLLDEPTSMLDPEAAATVRRAVLAASAGRTLVIADHHVEPWREHLDRIVVLGPGAQVLADGPPEEVLARRPELQETEPAPGPAPEAELRIEPGLLTVVTGASGAGKTTLLRSLAAEAGRRRGSLLLVPQDPAHFFLASTVRGELGDAADPAAAADARSLLDRAGLAHLAGANPHRLSGGEQRRLAIIAALAARPEVLLLDEPTVGLDAERRSAVLALLEEARDRGTAVVAASHDPVLVAAAGSRHHLEGTPSPAPTAASASAGATTPAPEASAEPDRRILPVPRAAHRPADALNPLMLCLIGILAAVGSYAVSTWQGGLLALLPTVLLAPLALRSVRGAVWRLTPVLLSAVSIAWTTALLSEAPALSGEAWLLGLKEACRITAFVAPGVIALTSLDVTALGDALGGRLRWPARPVVAVVAALVRAGHTGRQWEIITSTRVLRGRGGRRSPRMLAGATLALLVDSLRGAEQQALALDARGFATATRRTWALPSRFTRADLVGGAVAVLLLVWPALAQLLWASLPG